MTDRALRSRLVYDPALRFIHAWNALAVLGLLASGELAGQFDPGASATPFWRIHVWSGYALVIGLSARAAWGLLGPDEARWRALWHPGAWRTAWRRRRFFTAPENYGHHPLASLAYLLVYALLTTLAASGLALAAIDQNTGPLYGWLGHDVAAKSAARAPHEAARYGVWLFLIAHFAALALHPRLHGIPVAQAMLNGRQYLKEDR